jgi:hypothetical protein
MGVDAEHSSAVLAVLELLLGPDGLPGRFHVATRNDLAGSACSGMLAEVLRTADAVANLHNSLHTRPAAVQASRVRFSCRMSCVRVICHFQESRSPVTPLGHAFPPSRYLL